MEDNVLPGELYDYEQFEKDVRESEFESDEEPLVCNCELCSI